MPIATVKPTSGSGTWSNISAAYDGARDDKSTAAGASAAVNYTGNVTNTMTLSGFPSLPAGTYTQKVLNVNFAMTGYTYVTGSTPYMSMSYSLNGGSSWSTIGIYQSVSMDQTQAITLPLGQDTSLVLVQATVSATGGGAGVPQPNVAAGTVADVWIDGTYTASSSGKRAACASSN